MNSSSFGSHLDSISMAPSQQHLAMTRGIANPSVSNFSTASTYIAGSQRTSDSGTPTSQTNLIKHSRDDLSNFEASGLRSTRSKSKSINNSLNWSNNSNDGSTCDTVSIAISELPDRHTQVPGSPEQHLIKRTELMERIGMPANHSAVGNRSRNSIR